MRVKQELLKLSISLCTIMPAFLPMNIVPTIIGDISENIIKSEVLVLDDRAENIDAYFAKNNLPLAGHGETFVKVADKYDLDYRLLPAIAMRESTGGKNPCPYGNDANVFGWHSCKTKFSSYEESIDKVGAHLAGEIKSTKHYYGDKTVWKKLRTYNSVIKPYPDQVIAIMNKIETGPIDEQATKLAEITSKEVAMK
jgi:hypothetical protein